MYVGFGFNSRLVVDAPFLLVEHKTKKVYVSKFMNILCRTQVAGDKRNILSKQ